jgi:lipid-binding SYLF domain-containing protein
MRALTIRGGRLAIMLLAAGLAASPIPAGADDAMEARQLVEKARLTFERMIVAPEMDALRDLIQRARGVFVAPQVLRGAFIVGVAGGSGVLVTRGERPGEWNGPAFYTIGEVSFGFQAGGDASEVVLLAMTNRGVTALLGTSVKLGADMSVAAGPVGIGVRGATANLSVDIVSFASAKGLYGGVSIDGAVVATRSGLNADYYGKPVTPADILVSRAASNAHADALIELVRKAATPK